MTYVYANCKSKENDLRPHRDERKVGNVAKGFYFNIFNLSLKWDATNLLVISARILNVSDCVCVCTHSQVIAEGKLLNKRYLKIKKLSF